MDFEREGARAVVGVGCDSNGNDKGLPQRRRGRREKRGQIQGRASEGSWLVGEFAEPDLVAGFEDGYFFCVEGQEGVYGGLGDAVLLCCGSFQR